jgi:DNA-binding transcriptional LysR family regulator
LIGFKAEAAIYCRPDRALDPRLNYLPLFREQMMIVLPAEHRLAARETIEIADLAGERYVQRSFCKFNDMVDRVFDDRGIDCETDSRVDRIPLFRERMMIAMPRDHRLAGHPSIRLADLAGAPQIRRSRCEYNELVARLLRQHRIDCEIAFDSPRDDWALALIARGLGFALMPQHSIDHPAVLSRPLVEPTLWREASLFTCRERANGDGLDAIVQEATRMTTALAGVPAVENSLADDAR